MSDIETRLREALTARAELVRPEDLTRGAPRPEPRLPWWRHPGTYLVAAACVAVATVSVVALAVGSSDQADRRPPIDNSPSPTTMPPAEVPHTWARAPQENRDGARYIADVDGDGRDDEVTASAGSGLTVTTRGGPLTAPITDGAEVWVGGLVTIPGATTPVITVQAAQGAAGTEITSWHLFVVRGGRLVELHPTGPPLPQNVESQVTGGHDQVQTWLTTGAGPTDEIYTMRYIDEGTPVDGADYPGTGTTLYHVRFWRWVLDGSDLRAEPVGRGCIVPPSRAVVECP